MPTNFVFRNRQSTNPNRRRLTIIEQQGNEMLVDMSRADTNVTEEGTPLNADVLNQWNRSVDESESRSTNAVNTANQANTKSDNALSKATTAESNSTAAKNSAASALNQVNALVRDVDISQIDGNGVPSVSFVTNSDGTKKFSFKNLKGDKGDNVFVRYSFDKTSMTEQPTEETMYIGFCYGATPSNNVEDYSWSRMWGAKSINATEYAQLVLDGEVNPEQIYFIEGVADNKLIVTVEASSVKYSNSNSGLTATTMQSAIDELKRREFSKSYLDLNNKPTIPTNASFTLAGLSEKSYNSLTDKPTIPTNQSFRLDGLSERSYNSLTDKPIIPSNESFRLDRLSEKSYNSLTDKPTIPTNASFTLAGLSEKSYNSLTDKPTIPIIDKSLIAQVLGLNLYELENLIQLAKIANYDGQGIVFNTEYVDIQ